MLTSMRDAALRELERRFRSSGDVEAGSAWLAARVRVGRLTRARLHLAAQLGCAMASAALGIEPTAGWLTEQTGPGPWIEGTGIGRLETPPSFAGRVQHVDLSLVPSPPGRPRGRVEIEGRGWLEVRGEGGEVLEIHRISRGMRVLATNGQSTAIDAQPEGPPRRARPRKRVVLFARDLTSSEFWVARHAGVVEWVDLVEGASICQEIDENTRFERWRVTPHADGLRPALRVRSELTGDTLQDEVLSPGALVEVYDQAPVPPGCRLAFRPLERSLSMPALGALTACLRQADDEEAWIRTALAASRAAWAALGLSPFVEARLGHAEPYLSGVARFLETGSPLKLPVRIGVATRSRDAHPLVGAYDAINELGSVVDTLTTDRAAKALRTIEFAADAIGGQRVARVAQAALLSWVLGEAIAADV
jgi:hypothetical protein